MAKHAATPDGDRRGDRRGNAGERHDPPEGGRSARKRQAIIESATALFLRDGYRNTGMDQIAADAGVSKQTVYKQFADKEQLFREIILGVTRNSEAIIAALPSALNASVESPDDLEKVLTDLARRYI